MLFQHILGYFRKVLAIFDHLHLVTLVLGLGDLGIGGLGISIGKLDLYVAAGGFHPRRVLPCVLDIGTNNQSLIDDHRYQTGL